MTMPQVSIGSRGRGAAAVSTLTASLTASLLVALAGCAASTADPRSSAQNAQVLPASSENQTRAEEAFDADVASAWGLPATRAIAALVERVGPIRGATTDGLLPPASIAASLLTVNEEPLLGEAGMDREAVLALLPPLPDAPRELEPLDEDDRAEALKLYVEGRTALATGDTQSATRALRAASRLDPTSPDIWRMLAAAHQERGGRAAAIRAYERAVELGDRDGRALLYLGSDALRRNDAQLAARYFAEAVANEDEVLRIAAEIGLAESFVSLRQPVAAYQTLSTSLRPVDEGFARRAAMQSGARDILTQIVRRSVSLWITAGDLALDRGQIDDALTAYNRAIGASSTADPALRDRVIYAYMLQSRQGEAALEVLSALWARNGFVDDTLLDAIGYLSENADEQVAGLLATALAELSGELTGQISATAKVRLLLAGAASLQPAQAREMLITAAAASPESLELTEYALDSASSAATANQSAERAAWSAAVRLVAAAPELAEPISGMLEAKPLSWSALNAELDASTPASALLSAWTLHRVDRHRDAAEAADAARRLAVDSGVERPLLVACHAAVARLGVKNLRFDDAASSLQALQELATSVPELIAYARSLEASGRLAEAFAAMERAAAAAEGPAFPGVLTETARFATQAGEPTRAAELLERAAALDERLIAPRDELVSLYGPTGALANPELFEAAVAALRAVEPDGEAMNWLVAQELMRRGQAAAAARTCQELILAGNREETPMVTLVQLWSRLGTLAEGDAWFAELLEQNPEDETLARGLIRTRLEADEPEAAIETALAALELRPSEAIERLREMALRQLNETEASDLALDQRVQSYGATIQNRFEQAGRALDVRDMRTAADTIEGLAGAPTLRGREIEVLASITSSADSWFYRLSETWQRSAQGVGGVSAPDVAADYIRLIDAAETLGADRATNNAFVLRFRALTAFPENDLAAIADLLETAGVYPNPNQDAADFDPEFARRQRWAGAAIDLHQSGDSADAIELLSRSLDRDPNEVAGATLIQLVAAAGPLEDFEPTAERLHESDLIKAVNDELRPNRPIEPLTDDESVAEGLYLLASQANGNGRSEVAEAAYERLLELDATHPWANNDYGYALADRGEQLERAERMIETAYRQLPNQASVIDSLGWVRYKLGWIEDREGEDGTLELGAVSLLAQAASLPDGAGNYEVMDHLGDAQYVAGEPREAVRSWRTARRLLDDFLANRRVQQQEDLRERLTEAHGRVMSKLRAVESGQEPKVASTAARPDA